MGKLWLVEGFCPQDKYHCLMPVEYVPVEKNGEVFCYKKDSMACRKGKDGICEEGTACEFFKQAPEELDKNANWYEP
ncbi:MAG: hypothetical protein SO170_03860 [Butyribacter sp.]|nr:hypothetical protein [bacterium]MDY3854090.1 hypothetical protein [Butyribacter sp.]